MDRRTFLRAGVAGVTLGLAGCGGDSAETTQPPEQTTQPPAETPAPTPTAEPTTRTTQTTTAEPTTTTTTESTPTATTESTTTAAPTTTVSIDAEQVVDVYAEDRFRFGPETFTISTGDTVAWVWQAGGHNVTPNEMPAEADWTGSPGAPGELLSKGSVYRYTFTVPGEYSYYCAPHRTIDMVGSFTVEE